MGASSDLRIYVAVTSPYPWNRGVTKRRDILRKAQANEILKGLESGELSNGRGLNQEMVLKRAGDTR